MLVHGRDAILALADRCRIQAFDGLNGWHVDLWEMDEADVDAAIDVYRAVLAGGATDAVVALLNESGLDLNRYLINEDGDKEDITRADLTELTAAASLVAAPGYDVDRMQMPNVPKMSRRKSESGLDITVVNLRDDLAADVDLQDGEQLTIGSVKHSVGESAGSMRWKLVDSLSGHELTHAYMTDQLRVLNGQLIKEGRSKASAARIYLFLRDFPHRDVVRLFAVGVVDPDLKGDLAHHVELLPDIGRSERTFRMILLPGIRTVHERCP
jgi:hypothetical protein